MSSETPSIQALHILYSGFGGLGTYFMEFVRSDEEGAFDNKALFYGIEEPHDEYVAFCREHGIVHASVIKRQGLDLSSYLQVIRLLLRHRPDVVFIHSATTCLPVFFYAAFRRCRTVFVEHTPGAAKTRVEWEASRLAQRFADDVVVFYEQQIAELVERLGKAVRPGKIKIIPKSVNVRLFVPGVRPSSEELVIGMQSRLTPSKDHGTLLRAFAALTAEPYGEHLYLRIAGDGTTRDAHEALASELGISDRVTFTGTLTQAELSRFLQGLDIYVHASTGETICYAIMEAQAAGLPIVASDVEGINNVIRHNETGWLFRPGDSEDLSRILDRLLRDSEQRKVYGQVSRRLMEELARESNMARVYQLLLTVPATT